MPFVKGNKCNPHGRPKLTDEERMARILNRIAFERICNQYLHLSKDELEDIVRRKETPVIELMVASVVIKAIKSGDQHRLNFLLDRLIGKVPERVEIIEEAEKYDAPESMKDDETSKAD